MFGLCLDFIIVLSLVCLLIEISQSCISRAQRIGVVKSIFNSQQEVFDMNGLLEFCLHNFLAQVSGAEKNIDMEISFKFTIDVDILEIHHWWLVGVGVWEEDVSVDLLVLEQ